MRTGEEKVVSAFKRIRKQQEAMSRFVEAFDEYWGHADIKESGFSVKRLADRKRSMMRARAALQRV